MLVHFPSALYPFSLVTDCLGTFLSNESFISTGFYSLIAAVGSSVVAALYGFIDFLGLKPGAAWRKAALHAFLNAIWLMIFSSLLMFRIKHPEFQLGLVYLSTMAFSVFGLFYSNYLGADLIIRHKVGVEEEVN